MDRGPVQRSRRGLNVRAQYARAYYGETLPECVVLSVGELTGHDLG